MTCHSYHKAGDFASLLDFCSLKGLSAQTRHGERIKSYLPLINSLRIDSHVLWLRQTTKHMHLPKCSYHDIKAEAKSSGGHTLLVASVRSATEVASPSEEEIYGWKTSRKEVHS